MRRSIAALALCCVVLAACGSSGGSDSSAKASDAKVPGLSGSVNDHGTKTVSGGKIEIELDDDYFGPTFIKANAGDKVTLELKNEGTHEHNFSMKASKVDVDLDAGESKDVTITVPDSSTAYFCEYHQAKGMQGGFIVS